MADGIVMADVDGNLLNHEGGRGEITPATCRCGLAPQAQRVPAWPWTEVPISVLLEARPPASAKPEVGHGRVGASLYVGLQEEEEEE